MLTVISSINIELEKSSNAASDKVENLEAIIADPKSTASERKKAHEDLAMARREKEEAHHDRELPWRRLDSGVFVSYQFNAYFPRSSLSTFRRTFGSRRTCRGRI